MSNGVKLVRANGFITNPKDFDYPYVNEFFNVLINDKDELYFLKDVKLEEKNNQWVFGNSKPRLLANLLNNYDIGSWSNNPSGHNTTSGFILHYIGECYNAPDKYNFNPDAPYMAVMSLIVHNKYELFSLISES